MKMNIQLYTIFISLFKSIRNTDGCDQKKDFDFVAELLRQTSLEAARRYAHPTPDSKLDLVEGLRGPVNRG